MLMCSRMNIRTTSLLSHLTSFTWNSLPDMTRVCARRSNDEHSFHSFQAQSRRTKANFLSILSLWAETFPYDFRNAEMFAQLEDILQRISVSEPRLQSSAIDVKVKLQSKVNVRLHGKGERTGCLAFHCTAQRLGTARGLHSAIERDSVAESPSKCIVGQCVNLSRWNRTCLS